MDNDLRSNPDYSEGFWSAQDGEPLFHDASEAFRAGWHAYYRCVKIFEDNGFRRSDGGFVKSFSIKA